MMCLPLSKCARVCVNFMCFNIFRGIGRGSQMRRRVLGFYVCFKCLFVSVVLTSGPAICRVAVVEIELFYSWNKHTMSTHKTTHAWERAYKSVSSIAGIGFKTRMQNARTRAHMHWALDLHKTITAFGRIWSSDIVVNNKKKGPSSFTVSEILRC